MCWPAVHVPYAACCSAKSGQFWAARSPLGPRLTTSAAGPGECLCFASSHLSAPNPAAQTGADLGHGIEQAVAPELRDVERPTLNLPVRKGARKA